MAPGSRTALKFGAVGSANDDVVAAGGSSAVVERVAIRQPVLRRHGRRRTIGIITDGLIEIVTHTS